MSDNVLNSAQAFIDMHFERKPISVLEAGGGSLQHIRIPRNSHITVIDISEEQIQKNDYANEKIVSDIQEYNFSNKYDLIVLYNVIEHLEFPERALDNLMHAIRTGGLILIAAPNPLSLKGLVTKFTPHWFHIWFYRRILGNENAGKPGFGPFKTYLRLSATPYAIKRYCKRLKFSVPFSQMRYTSFVDKIRYKSTIMYIMYMSLAIILKILSLGNMHPKKTEFIIILKRDQESRPSK